MTEEITRNGLTLEQAVFNLKKLLNLTVVLLNEAVAEAPCYSLLEAGSLEAGRLPVLRRSILTAEEVIRLGEAALLRNVLLGLEQATGAANQIMHSALEKAEHVRDFYGREYEEYASTSASAVIAAGGDAMMVKYDLVKRADSAQKDTSEFHAFVMSRRIELDMLLGLKSPEQADAPHVEEEDLSNPER
jgi:hypothetical protein